MRPPLAFRSLASRSRSLKVYGLFYAKLMNVPDVLTAQDLTLSQERTLPQFSPPPRFGETSFAGYKPQHPSQKEASKKTRTFTQEVTKSEPTSFRWPWQDKKVAKGRGLYLDGGFGTGKTHLLAAAYHACEAERKAYMSFQELVYVIGAQGMAQAKENLSYDLFCVDEFELDDPGNTLIVKTFLSHAFAQGSFVMTTSNTPPEAQGRGRFNASDFKREIQSIAERFDAVLLEGPDYRQRDYLAELLSEEALGEAVGDRRRPESQSPPRLARTPHPLERLSPDSLQRPLGANRHALPERDAHPARAERRLEVRALHRQALRPQSRLSWRRGDRARRPLQPQLPQRSLRQKALPRSVAAVGAFRGDV